MTDKKEQSEVGEEESRLEPRPPVMIGAMSRGGLGYSRITEPFIPEIEEDEGE